MRRLVAVVAGTSIVLEANMWVSLGVLMFGALLDEIKNFFANVVEDEKIETTVAEFPSGDEVVLIKEAPKDDK